VTPNLSAGFLGAKLTNGSDGVHIVGVVSGSPAELAGLKAGDLFAAIDDQGIGTAQQVQAILNSRKPGDSIKIRVTRNGQLFETTAHLTGRSGDTSATMQVIPAATTSTSELTQFGAGFAALGFNTSIQVEGLRVTQVASGSTAEKSGLQVDDILIRVGDQKFESGDVLPMLIRLFSPGTQRINLIRGGQSVFIEWTTPNDMSDAINAQPARLGVSYDIVTPQNAAELKLSVEYGALVKAVSAGSPADVAGIKVGDVIIAVEEDKVDAKRTLAIRMIPYVTGDTLMLSVVRGSETLKIRVTLVNRGNALIPGEKILL
jgi:S1-C subfamily serine protease